MKQRIDSKNVSLRRRPPQFEAGKVILIVCEGTETEPNYFHFLRRKLNHPTMQVKICKKCGSAAISVVNYAVSKKKECGIAEDAPLQYDSIWCVMDVEAKLQESLDRALDKAKGNGLLVALSNPNIEYWFLLHYEEFAKSLQSSEQSYRTLKKHDKDYEKNSIESIKKIYPNTKEAIRRAKKIERDMHWGENLKHHNPSTRVYKVVEEIFKIKDTKDRDRSK